MATLKRNNKTRYSAYRVFSSKAALITGVILIVLLICAAFAIDHAIKNVLPYSPIRPHRVTQGELRQQLGTRSTPSGHGLTYVDISVDIDDTIALKGWFIPASTDTTRGTIIMLHGIASTKSSMLEAASHLTRSGFNCVVYDSRANGESGGLNCTFGYYEKYDLIAIIDEVEKRFPNAGPFGVYGTSLGASVAVQGMAISQRIVCGVVECPFASLREVIHDYFKRQFLVPINAIPDAALANSERIANFLVDSVQPAVSARRVVQPIMVVHGLADEHISAEHGKRVFANVASNLKVWYPIENGAHNDLARVGGLRYRDALISFFIKHLSASSKSKPDSAN